jgi:hypothetical protein
VNGNITAISSWDQASTVTQKYGEGGGSGIGTGRSTSRIGTLQISNGNIVAVSSAFGSGIGTSVG